MQNAVDDFNLQLVNLVELTLLPLTKDDRQRIMCLIILDSHSRDVAIDLLKLNCRSKNDFNWQRHLRPTLTQEAPIQMALDPKLGKGPTPPQITTRCVFKICDATFDYGFEYYGNGPRLVITPLTDRIYVSATQAIHLKMGCAPTGPSGTGKTETTKNLAATLGKCWYIFNCTPQMDYRSMGNIFKGLSASGSWGCLHEFNRLTGEVLSVCSVQFKAMCDALKGYTVKSVVSGFVTIEGDKVGLDPTCGVFTTMNLGYLGRSDLPEGLKALFRPINVLVPYKPLICESILRAEGFVNAEVLASKFCALYELLAQLLSEEGHYDWGLRAMKSVLVVAGTLKRAEPPGKSLGEDSLLMRALRDLNAPKIVQADEAIFFGLIDDIFPNLSPPRDFDDELAELVANACDETGLWADPYFTLKVMQLDEMLDVRHSVFVMGPPG
jgi:dynein heavy chain